MFYPAIRFQIIFILVDIKMLPEFKASLFFKAFSFNGPEGEKNNEPAALSFNLLICRSWMTLANLFHNLHIQPPEKPTLAV